MRKESENGNYRYVFVYDESGNPNYVEEYTSYSDTTPTKYFYVLNLQGDVVQLRDSSNAVVANYTYDAWGRLISVKNASGSTISDSAHIANVNPIRYRGYFYDTETKLYYCNSRYYDPQIKRFINADEFVSTGQDFAGFNMFAYCGNNPVIRLDNGGDLWSLVCAGIGAAVGGLVSGISKAAEYVSSGKSIEWDKVVFTACVGAASGAASGFLSSFGLHPAATVALDALISGGESVACQMIDQESILDADIDFGEVAVDMAVGAAFSLVDCDADSLRANQKGIDLDNAAKVANKAVSTAKNVGKGVHPELSKAAKKADIAYKKYLKQYSKKSFTSGMASGLTSEFVKYYVKLPKE